MQVDTEHSLGGDKILEVVGVDAGYGKMQVLRDISLNVHNGECVVCMGPNGAGKSTLLKAIAGLVGCSSGEVRIAGTRVDGLAAHRIARAGVALIPQGRRLFNDLTVMDNILMGGFIKGRAVSRQVVTEFVEDQFPELVSKLGALAGTLSGGQQQMVSLARGLVRHPVVLLLDEPSVGLAPIVVDRFADRLAEVRRTADMAILLVEQNAHLASKLGDRVFILRDGSLRPGQKLGEMGRGRAAEEYLWGLT